MNKAPLPSPKLSTLTQITAADDDAAPSPTVASTSPSSRHPLQRLPHSVFAHSEPSAGESSSESTQPRRRDYDATDSEMSDSNTESQQDEERSESEGGADGTDEKPGKVSPDELEIERLRSLQSKILQNQQRVRSSRAPGTNSPGALRGRRVSPIKEELTHGPAMSPTLEGAFSTPLATGGTTSTESTESTESGRTIRGSLPPTPAGYFPLRTPSYPFPTVPTTPRTWSTSFHQPFMSLSPTVSALYTKDYSASKERIASETSTPAASSTPFAPDGRMTQSPIMEDSRFPTPSLYDLVLLLSLEPGLHAWWSCVTTILHDWYGVDRATLAIPADVSDIENVPWGQKTAFNASAQKENYRGGVDAEAKKSRREKEAAVRHPEVDITEPQPQTTRGGARPPLLSRHSFAGHEWQRSDIGSDSPPAGLPTRPRGPSRTASHAPHSVLRGEHPLRQVSPAPFDGQRAEPTFSDPEFSSIGGDVFSAQHTAVFPVLRALDHEPDALIDNAGINRVLERGRLVTLTRDYSTTLSTSRKNSIAGKEDQSPKAPTRQPNIPSQEAHKTTTSRERPTLASRSTHANQVDTRLQPRYEEYEQYPSSPWAQSPAPSPAIQNDPSENPFFTPTTVDEDSFNPSVSSQDYTQFGQVEAIGVDKASTVIHIPLIHPTLSQLMQPPEISTPHRTPSMSRRASEQSVQSAGTQPEAHRKAPIAILSILSATVPYPRNLTDSLKLLATHLATSFSMAVQFTNMQAQANSVHHRRQQLGFEPVTDRDSLDDLLHLDLENISNSAAGSMTSPSDYSGRSKYSPGGSIGGTPGWDPSSVGLSSRHSVGNTPVHVTGAEAVESYFDARKKSTRSQNQATLAPQDNSSRKSDKRPIQRTSPTSATEEDTPASRLESGTSQPHDEAQSSRRARILQSQGNQYRTHSLLHSYGADFGSSFQPLPTATTPGAQTPGATSTHTRRNSLNEVLDMPPPSESLLRTIIDSLPVQIFTALPTTGALTWVNSKFLVYRGQDSRQVLQDPWDAIHVEDRPVYLEQWHKSLRTGQQLQQKVRLQRFDGHYRWFYVRVAPLKNKRQQIVHWIGTNMDFHEQHLAEMNSARQQETAASEAKYRALANSSPQVVFVVSNRRGLTFCNSQWLNYSGQTEIQARVNGFLEYVHPEDIVKCKLPEMSEDGSIPLNVPTTMPTELQRKDSTSSSDDSSDADKTITSPGSSSPDKMDMPQAKLSKLATTGILKVTRDADGRASYSTEVRLRNKDGEYRWHLVRILLERSLAEDSSEETWYGTATDINDHKLLEQTLKETMDAKSRFLSNMSHEIRTPLNGISGMVNFLLDSILSAEQLEHVNIIKASTDSLLNLINDILDLSKVEAGMIKLSMEWLHIPSLLEEVNDLNMGLAIQKGLELNYLVDEGVPSMVKGDKFRIRQVLLNVVGNAIKFTQKGEVFVRCRMNPPERGTTLKDNETMVKFEVIDTGRGFTETEAKYLFKRFSQIDASSTRQHGGTGLGLAISMQFVELHGGNMDARSVPGKGSVFFFTLKFGLPTADDFPKPVVATPGTPALEPVVSTAPVPIALQKQALPPTTILGRKDRVQGITMSPSPMETAKSPVPSLTTSEHTTRDSPTLSSGSSDMSVTGKSSLRSERSSASSYMVHDPNLMKDPKMHLALPIKRIPSDNGQSDDSGTSIGSDETAHPSNIPRSLSPLANTLQPPMYSILVVCPLVHSREATIRHIKNTLPQGIPHQVTGQSSLVDAQRMIGGDDPVLFTHIVLVLHETVEVIAIMDQILHSLVHSTTSIVVVSDPQQKKELIKVAPEYNYEHLMVDRRLQFIYRPLKPSKFAVIFDPEKQRESSTDRNQDSAHQVVVSQKLVFEDLKRRLGGKGHKVLLVEDNAINQTVVLKFLAKIDVDTETVLDGVQCTDLVFSKPIGYFSIILCDLHMPNKDGYQACKEIRRWEKKNGHRRVPIIALSANVLGDVYSKCVDAGFNSYVTKPVEFKELSLVLANFLDPADPSKQPETMKRKP
ncbi:autoinducer 2 sensor kinase/phosphatase-like protein luxQ [Amniculicola lignicola CBS 123094]|uniref:histidine kinase n=1 Tax=Amniculicola lignicola CBS 123094 TaxID=1392246 RepID=A0A6A5X488_9PLEO|nr:autoinducer 2 sensor kinase/phosphatase-like protein luxQ [Amniculicola lignicola CBS 123094]